MDAKQIASTLILYSLVLMAVYQDFKSMKVSNRLIVIGYVFGLGVTLLQKGQSGVAQYLLGIVVPVVLLFSLFVIRILGAGDIKLLSMIGGFLNFKELLWCIGLSFLIGAVESLLVLLKEGILVEGIEDGASYLGQMLWEKKLLPNENRKDKRHLTHFTLSICLALVIVKGVM